MSTNVPVTIWSPPTEAELSYGAASTLVDQSNNTLVDQFGNSLITGTATVTELAATPWANTEATPVTIWAPPSEGELSFVTTASLVDQSNNTLVDQLGNILSTGVSFFTPLDTTLWVNGEVPTGATQDEGSGYILDELGAYIEAEDSTTGEGIPTTIWAPATEGELNLVTSSNLVDQLGNTLVDELGDTLITGVSEFSALATSLWVEDDSV